MHKRRQQNGKNRHTQSVRIQKKREYLLFHSCLTCGCKQTVTEFHWRKYHCSCCASSTRAVLFFIWRKRCQQEMKRVREKKNKQQQEKNRITPIQSQANKHRLWRWSRPIKVRTIIEHWNPRFKWNDWEYQAVEMQYLHSKTLSPFPYWFLNLRPPKSKNKFSFLNALNFDEFSYKHTPNTYSRAAFWIEAPTNSVFLFSARLPFSIWLEPTKSNEFSVHVFPFLFFSILFLSRSLSRGVCACALFDRTRQLHT